ncbi:MAG: hypothetical protein ABI645_12510 [Pseudomonadota bacterium]
MTSSPSDSRDLLRLGYESYLERMRAGGLEPDLPYLPYDFARFWEHTWTHMGGAMIQGELRDFTNLLNDWQNRLTKWHAWNCVLVRHNEQDAWGLRKEFLEADAHLCLTCPSSIRDALVFVVTNGVHQARLASEKGYRDYLDGDPTTPGTKSKQFPRRKREERLEALLAPWPEGTIFMSKLRVLDDDSYRNSTLDYRNEHSHAIGPSLEIGVTRFVTRIVRQAFRMVQQADGTFRDELIAGVMAVSYGFGGRDPLGTEISRKACLEQFQIARECFTIYVSILDTVRQTLPVTGSKH